MRRGGEGEVNWEIRFDIKTLQYVKYITSVILLYSIVQNLLYIYSSVLCDDLDAWDGE